MRTARLRYDQDLTYYHCMNRIAGQPGQFPFGENEKAQIFATLHRLSVFYTVDLLSFAVMGNHWHLVCAVHPEPPELDEVRRRYCAFYRPQVEPDWQNHEWVATVAARMRDISQLLKDLQQQFTNWFNRTRVVPRRGTLWAGRFKSLILDGQKSLWECIKYVELNPVRAKIESSPRNYRFSSWGQLHTRGTHPFANTFFRHMRRYLGEQARNWSDDRVAAELDADISRVHAAESAPRSGQNLHEVVAKSRSSVPFELALTRRVRHWSDGAIIGTPEFVRDLATKLFSPERAARQRMTPASILAPEPDGTPPDRTVQPFSILSAPINGEVCAFRRLRVQT